MNDNSNLIERYKAGDRVTHGLLALAFIVAGLTGLAMYHPSFFWLNSLFGGGQWTRILHPFLGVTMFLFFFIAMVKFWSHNILDSNDMRWLGNLGKVLRNEEEGVPPIGKYNPGQKLLFWALVLSMLMLLLSGIVLWRPWFAPMFSVEALRLAAVVHVVGFVILMLGMVVHIYSAIWWIKGSVRAITRGTVTKTWARAHHPLWYRDVTSGRKD